MGADLEWEQSSIFYDDWFGTNSPSNDHHVVDTGRWAYTRVLTDARSYSNITNPYGLLRSPWNTNPVHYLMRSDYVYGSRADAEVLGFPSCENFAEYLNTSFARISNAINGVLHGPIHIMIGGQWNNLDIDPVLEARWNSVTCENLSPDALLLLSKVLWRAGYLHVPEFFLARHPRHRLLDPLPRRVLRRNLLGPVAKPDRHGSSRSSLAHIAQRSHERKLDQRRPRAQAVQHGLPGRDVHQRRPAGPHLLAAPRQRGTLRAVDASAHHSRRRPSRSDLGLQARVKGCLGRWPCVRLVQCEGKQHAAACVHHGHVLGPPRRRPAAVRRPHAFPNRALHERRVLRLDQSDKRGAPLRLRLSRLLGNLHKLFDAGGIPCGLRLRRELAL